MMPIQIPPGGNRPLDGQRVVVDLAATSLGGARFVAEDGGEAKVVDSSEPSISLTATGAQARGQIDLSSVPATISRLRLVVWSEQVSRVLTPADARISVDGEQRFTVAVEGARTALRSAEVLEIYRRHGAWKVRAVALGWAGHIGDMATALKLPESAFSAGPGAPMPARPVPAPEHMGGAPAMRRGAARVHRGPSPAVGPVPLRDLVDEILGPGPRNGTDDYIGVELGGVTLGLIYEDRGNFISIKALTGLGTGTVTNSIAEASLRVTAEAPLARVTVDDDSALATAVAIADHANLSSALLKALLCEVWVTGYRFGQAVRSLGWSMSDAFTAQVPRELRLGVAEDLQSFDAWGDMRTTILNNDGTLPLVDDPATVLLLDDMGQLTVGPCLLHGTNRAWSVIVERALRCDVTDRGQWRAVAALNQRYNLVRFGLFTEVGVDAPLAITGSFAGLQLPRTQVFEDIQAGLGLVEDTAREVDGTLMQIAPQGPRRNNLPALPTRRWTGPGTEVRQEILVRELSSLPEDAPVPAGFLDRVRASRGTLGRPGTGYLAHLVLQRAERGDARAQAWVPIAQALVEMTPISAPGPKCAAASIHVRMGRLLTSVKPRRTAPPPPSSPPRTPTWPGPEPAAPAPQRKRWRLFR